MVEISAFDKTVVDKEVLVAAGFLRRFRLSDKPIDIHVIGLLLHRYQFGRVTVTQYLYNALLHRSLFEVEHLLPVTAEREKDTWERHRHPDEFIHDMT